MPHFRNSLAAVASFFACASSSAAAQALQRARVVARARAAHSLFVIPTTFRVVPTGCASGAGASVIGDVTGWVQLEGLFFQFFSAFSFVGWGQVRQLVRQ